MNVEDVRIETDERGFELHLVVGDDIRHDDDGLIILNIDNVAEQLWNECVKHIGPWLLERDQAKAAYDRRDPYEDEDGPWPGESVESYYRRTGQDGPLREVADAMNKARKEA